jgi:DNA-binding transcriptional MerR regulator
MNCGDKDQTAPQEAEVVWLDDTGADEPPTSKVLSLANVAAMFGVSPLRLFYYELRGLVRRQHLHGRELVYGWADCERIAFIIKCRRAGLPLREIISVVRASDADDATSGAFLEGQERCALLIERLERRRTVIGEALAELGHVQALLTTKNLSRYDTTPRD